MKNLTEITNEVEDASWYDIHTSLREWAESIIDECSDKAGRDVWEYVQQVKDQL